MNTEFLKQFYKDLNKIIWGMQSLPVKCVMC